MIKPYYNSDDIIEAVKRKISFPTSQNTFSDDDILAFANEEMAISQVPSVLSFHEEYFVYSQYVKLENNRAKYPIPERAIGMKMRDFFYVDTNGNLSDMTKIKPEDAAFFQSSLGSNQIIYKYFVEGNDIILTPLILTQPTGFLLFKYYLRPNQLVDVSRASTVTNFTTPIKCVASSMSNGDTITINNVVFTAVTGAPGPNQFQINASSVVTAVNLTNAINLNGTLLASDPVPSTDTVTLIYYTLPIAEGQDQFSRPAQVLGTIATTSNPTAFIIPSTTQGIQFSTVSTVLSNGSSIDFLQTKAGHKSLALSIIIPNNGISGNIITFNASDIPLNLVVGDYICLESESIIPQIPSDLHTGLAEKTASRILAAIGDQAGLAISDKKIQEIEKAEGTLLDNRTESNPIKVTARHSLLRYGKMGTRRRM